MASDPPMVVTVSCVIGGRTRSSQVEMEWPLRGDFKAAVTQCAREVELAVFGKDFLE